MLILSSLFTVIYDVDDYIILSYIYKIGATAPPITSDNIINNIIVSLDGAVRLQEKRKPSHLDFCINNRAFLIRTIKVAHTAARARLEPPHH